MIQAVLKNIILVVLFRACFDHFSLNQMQTTKHVHSITHFHSWFFLTFPLKFHLYKTVKFKPVFLSRVWEWRGIGTDCPVIRTNYLQQRSQFTEMILPSDIPQLDIPDVDRNRMFFNFFSFQSVKSFQYKRFIETACLNYT